MSARDRRALQAVAVQFFVNGAVFASFVPRLPEVRGRIDVSIATLGLLLTASAVFGFFGSGSASPIIERFGTRRTLVVGSCVLVASLPLIGLARSPIVFVVGLAGLALADVIVDICMNLQGSWLSARRSAPVMNRLHGLWSLGTVVGGLVAAQAAASDVSLPMHLVAVSALLMATVVFVGRGLLTEDEHRTESPDCADSTRPAPSTVGLLLLALAGGCAIAIELTSSDWAAFRLTDDFGTDVGFAGLGFVAFTTGMTVGRFAGDTAVVRLGSGQVFRGATVVSALGLLVASFAPDRSLVLVGYAIAGIGIATFFPRLYDDAAQTPGRPGAALGALTAGSRVAQLVAPPAVGALAATSLGVGDAVAIVTLPTLAVLTLARTRK